MRLFKLSILPIIILIVYLSLLGTVFFGGGSITDIGTTIGLQIILIIFLQLTLIPLNTKTIKRVIIITIGLGIITSLLGLLFLSKQHTVFLFLTHISFTGFFLSRYYLIDGSRKRYYWSTSHQGLSTISMMLAITYTATIWVAGTAVNLNCSDLQSQSMGFMTKFMPTSSTGFISQISNKIESRGSQSVGQLLGAENYSGTSLSGSTVNNISITTGDTLTGSSHSGIIGSLLSYQSNAIETLIKNQNIINAQVCDVTLSHIQTLASSNNIQIIVFILLVFLIYLFMKSITFVIGIVNYIILLILFKTGRFYRKHHKDDIEDVYI